MKRANALLPIALQASYQLVVNGATTLSPNFKSLTPDPASTMTPVNSWPMMKPGSAGSRPLKVCSSLSHRSALVRPAERHWGVGAYEPHRAVAWILTMMSSSCCTNHDRSKLVSAMNKYLAARIIKVRALK